MVLVGSRCAAVDIAVLPRSGKVNIPTQDVSVWRNEASWNSLPLADHKVLSPGQKIQFHGGWDGKKAERCPICNFHCAYIESGVIIERYQIWDVKSQKSFPHPNDLWVARLETGSYMRSE